MRDILGIACAAAGAAENRRRLRLSSAARFVFGAAHKAKLHLPREIDTSPWLAWLVSAGREARPERKIGRNGAPASGNGPTRDTG